MDPELLKDIDELNRSLHSTNLSIKNRLLSIIKDSKYVAKIHDEHYQDLPVIPNERCGKWYVSTPYDTTSYFKSTDGHTNNWSFSTRRLNLHLLGLIRSNNGIIIVDATRRGKKMPDSFSKTIPIWISIMNKFLKPDALFNDIFVTPVETVSAYEHERILDLLPSFYENIGKFKDVISSKIINSKDTRILRPFWIYPGCKKLPIFTGLEDFIPVILISASERSLDGENKSFGFSYVQGAGDDHELWSFGLTPSLFWNNQNNFEGLENMNNDDVRMIVEHLVNDEKRAVNQSDDDKVGCFWKSEEIVNVNDKLSFGKIDTNLTFKKSELTSLEYDKIIVLDSNFKYVNNVEGLDKLFQYELDSGSKKSSKLFRKVIPDIINKIEINDKVLVLCNSGEDMSIGVVLCCLNSTKQPREITKESLRRDLIELMGLKKVNPQRATLNSVNSYLMK